MNNEYQIEGERKETYSVVARRSEKQIKGKKDRYTVQLH